MTTYRVSYIDNQDGKGWQRVIDANSPEQAREALIKQFPAFTVIVKSVCPVRAI